jgi:hypothetical protein
MPEGPYRVEPVFHLLPFSRCSVAPCGGDGTACWQRRRRWLIAVVSVALSMSFPFRPGRFELNRFIIRAGYLVVVSVLLVYLGRHEARLRDEIGRIAGWLDIVPW